MDTDLVGTAGMDTQLEEGVGADGFAEFEVGEESLSAAVDAQDAGFRGVFL